MMLRHAAPAVLVALTLAACGDEAREPKTAEEVVAEAGELAQPEPGHYETRVKILQFSVPGLPQQQADKLKSMMGNVGEETSSFCLTPEEAKKGFEESVRKMSQGRQGLSCQFDEFDVDGGKLAAELTCSGGQGMTATMQLDGTATARSTSMHMVTTQKAAMIPGGEMRIEMQMDSRRTGDCAA